MKKFLISILSYSLIFFNTNLLGKENINTLKIGLLAPLSGEYKELGNSLLYSLQLALDEINDKNVFIVPRDLGFNDNKKLNSAIKEIRAEGVNIIIGPISNNDFGEIKKFNDVIFISPSNISPEFSNNTISVGISLESQLNAIIKFIKKQKRKKDDNYVSKNQYEDLIEKKLEKLNLQDYKIFKYSADPQVLTGEIEKLTNYNQRKRNLELRKKCLRIKKMISRLKL